LVRRHAYEDVSMPPNNGRNEPIYQPTKRTQLTTDETRLLAEHHHNSRATQSRSHGPPWECSLRRSCVVFDHGPVERKRTQERPRPHSHGGPWERGFLGDGVQRGVSTKRTHLTTDETNPFDHRRNEPISLDPGTNPLLDRQNEPISPDDGTNPLLNRSSKKFACRKSKVLYPRISLDCKRCSGSRPRGL
jgi:hypothetical protein